MKKADKPEGKEIVSKPLTLEEIHEATEKRIEKIQQEFRDGFKLIEKHPRSVTFFGSARLSENHPSYIQARNLAKKIVGDLDYAVFTGGGPGIMEAGNRGAHETGGSSLGLRIQLPEAFAQKNNLYVSKYADFYYFFSRKVCLSFSAEAYVFFPGGFGTFNELFEILMLVQTGKIEKVPVILVGKKFWKSFDKMVKKLLLKKNLIDKDDVALYTITDRDTEILDIIKKSPVRNGLRFNPDK